MDEGRQKSVGVGLALGVAFGAAWDNVGMGLAFGIALGVAFGSTGMFTRRKKGDGSESEPEDTQDPPRS